MIKWLLGALLLLAPSLALAQNQNSGIRPSGSFTPGHTVRCQNSTCTVVVDGGGSAGSSINGQGYLTEIGITNTGTPFCINDALTNSPGGYHQFCLGANALGGGLISYNAYGGASPLGLNINVNGVSYPFPGAGNGNVIGPTSPTPTAGDLALWNGGLTLKDGGPVLTNFIDIRSYGGGTGVANNATAFVNAYAAAAAAQLPLVIGPGTYNFTSTPTVSMPADACVPVMGVGQDETILAFAANTPGPVFNVTNTSPQYISGGCTPIQRLTITTASTPGSNGAALTINGNRSGTNYFSKYSTFTDLMIRGSTSTNGWAFGMQFNESQQIYVNRVFISGPTQTTNAGIGIQFNGSNIADAPVILTVSHSFLIGQDIGIDFEGFVEGLDVHDSNLNFLNEAIKCNALPASFPPARPQCIIHHNQINTTGSKVAVEIDFMNAWSVDHNLMFCNNGCLSLNSVLQGIADNNIFDNIATANTTTAVALVNSQSNILTPNVFGVNLFANNISLDSNSAENLVGPQINEVNGSSGTTGRLADNGGLNLSIGSVTVAGGSGSTNLTDAADNLVGTAIVTTNPSAAIIENLTQTRVRSAFASLSTPPGSGKNTVATLYIDNVATAFTCTISGAVAAGCSVSGNLIMGAGQGYYFLMHPDSGAAAATAQWTLRLDSVGS